MSDEELKVLVPYSDYAAKEALALNVKKAIEHPIKMLEERLKDMHQRLHVAHQRLSEKGRKLSDAYSQLLAAERRGEDRGWKAARLARNGCVISMDYNEGGGPRFSNPDDWRASEEYKKEGGK